MDDLVATNRIVIDWPLTEPLPKCGEKIYAGELGTALVVTTQSGKSRRKPPFKRVELEIFRAVE